MYSQNLFLPWTNFKTLAFAKPGPASCVPIGIILILALVNITHSSRAADERAKEADQTLGPKCNPSKGCLLRYGETLAWKRRWEKAVNERNDRRLATAWTTPWEQKAHTLYDGLTKAEATALFLMRTEVIGLNAWLAAIQVPGYSPRCQCGWPAQTVRHVLLHCTKHDRTDLLLQTRTERLDQILSRPDCAKHAARWLVQTGLLGQFKVAKEILEEDKSRFRPFQDASSWE